ncbi:uncharacterized protein LOC134451582 [Engraulis encrasicolus]|uniref:uncharacterized protein LOC134451582 n=1 Tax=Engraulis encrasicolus TaxID=184585 RepID=UPI002FCED774
MQRYSTQQSLEMILDGADPCESDGEDINLQMDSDSELSQLSSDEESDPQPTKRARLATDVTETAKDGTVWHEEQVTVGKHIIERLESKLEQALKQEPLDIDFLEFVCQSEISLIASLSTHLDLPPEVLKGLQELSALVNDRRKAIVVDKTLERGRPKLNVHQEHVEELMAMDLSVPCIARLLGVSQRTLTRRMREWGLSMMDSYSTMSDEELDKLITEIKEVLPNLGYRQVRRRLNKLGYRVQWNRIIEAMHRIDGIGILQRMNKLGVVMSGTDKVPSPLSLVYIETNYKLVR